ncbi:hypothetical protein HYY75_08690 [bacterium]|nr:hypothetical protein [bacterium]
MGQAARQISKSTGFPILNPKLDPYGYAAELEKILNNQNDPEKSCKQLRDLISIIRQFKGS